MIRRPVWLRCAALLCVACRGGGEIDFGASSGGRGGSATSAIAGKGGGQGGSGGEVGTGGMGGSGPAGAPPLGPECVQITIDDGTQIPMPAVFPADDSNIHVFWEPGSGVSSCFLHVDTYSTAGAVVVQREYPITFQGQKDCQVDGVLARAPNGVFMITGGSGYILGTPADPVLTTSLFPTWPGNAVRDGWDGEAFAVHIVANKLMLARVSESGELLGLTPAHFLAGSGYEGRSYAIATDPSSGISISTALTLGVGLSMTGHDRMGNDVQGVDADGRALVVPEGSNDGLGLALLNGHAMSTFSNYLGLVVATTLQTDLSQTSWYLAPWGEGTAIGAQSIAPMPALGPDVVWMAGIAGTHLDELVLDSTKQRKRRMIVAPVGPDYPWSVIGFRYVQTVTTPNGDRWVAFQDYTNDAGARPDSSAKKHNPLRILKVLDSCTYQTQYDLDRQAGM